MPDAPAASPAIRTPSPLLIFAGLAGGLLLGALMADAPWSAGLLQLARPIGKLWLDGLTMTVVPLVFALVVTGIATAVGATAGRISRHAAVWFALLLVAVSLLAALLTPALLAAWPVPAAAGTLSTSLPPPPIAPAADWLQNIIPQSPVRAAADMAMVPLIVFAVLLGFALSHIAAPRREAMVTLLQALADSMLVIVGWVLWLAPLGVFALTLSVGAAAGLGAAGVLGHYVLVIIAICLAAALLSVTVAVLLTRQSPLAFLRAALPAQLVAASTQSSLASLPAMVAAAGPLGAGDSARIVLPLAVSLFRAASAAANVAVAVYLAQVHGVELAPADLLGGALIAALVSVAAVGLPAQVSFFAVIGPVCLAMGVPVVLLPLLLAIETVPDIFRTIGNVTGHLAVARIVGHRASRHGLQPDGTSISNTPAPDASSRQPRSRASAGMSAAAAGSSASSR